MLQPGIQIEPSPVTGRYLDSSKKEMQAENHLNSIFFQKTLYLFFL